MFPEHFRPICQQGGKWRCRNCIWRFNSTTNFTFTASKPPKFVIRKSCARCQWDSESLTTLPGWKCPQILAAHTSPPMWQHSHLIECLFIFLANDDYTISAINQWFNLVANVTNLTISALVQMAFPCVSTSLSTFPYMAFYRPTTPLSSYIATCFSLSIWHWPKANLCFCIWTR